MKNKPRIRDFNISGQTTLQLIVPLVLVLLVLIAFAFMIPMLSTLQTFALTTGMVIFIASFASTDIALYILIFSMLLSPEFVVGTTEGAALGRGVTLRLDDFLIVVIGMSWLAKMSIKKELGLFLRTPLNKPIAYYIIVCLVSTLFGAMFGRVDLKTGFLFVLKYFEYMIIYFMVANHLESKKQVRNYLWAILITCAIVSIIGVAQIPGGGRVSAPFEGEVGEPNTLGGYLVLMISIAMGLFLTSNSSRDQFIYSLLVLLFAIPLVYTQSRSSYLAAIPAILAFVWLSEKRHWVIVGVVLLGISLPFIAPNPAKERVTYTFTQGKNQKDVVELGGVRLDTSLSDRLRSWKGATKDWVEHPFLGFGVTGYRFVDGQYLRVITETGLLGLITFLLLITTIFQLAYNVFRGTTEPFHKGLAMGLLAGFIGLLCHAIGANTFIIVRIMEPFWLVTAMVVMIPEIEKEA
ncbi:MAG: O-antigen ligase family protein [Deltaproteobacteria bacterium]|nr:MAG: O-antigen ligase family protein [Deltaproteobacteria bacterium]